MACSCMTTPPPPRNCLRLRPTAEPTASRQVLLSTASASSHSRTRLAASRLSAEMSGSVSASSGRKDPKSIPSPKAPASSSLATTSARVGIFTWRSSSSRLVFRLQWRTGRISHYSGFAVVPAQGNYPPLAIQVGQLEQLGPLAVIGLGIQGPRLRVLRSPDGKGAEHLGRAVGLPFRKFLQSPGR